MTASLPDALKAFDLTGRVAIVTGASSGIGDGIARGLAAAGAKVALVARRLERLEPLAAELGGAAVAADLLDQNAVDSVIPAVEDKLGAPRILINAAGAIFSHDAAETETLENIRKTFELNIISPLRLSQAAFPHMAEAGSGSIINISSVSGHVGIPGIPQASYAATKLGLSGLTAELAVQWGRKNVRVNTIAPGFFKSEITEDLFATEKGQRWLDRNQILKMQGTPADFVGAVLWLASDASAFVTGQTVVVDGGWTKR